MAVFVYEVDGLRVAGDVERRRAEAWAKEEAFQSDLNQRNHNGEPIWDEDSKIKVLVAEPSEILKWKESRDQARKDGTIEPNDVEWLAFLVPATHVLEDDVG